ncbi:hypothetical protein RFI_05411 [Reticulomyxa filosa]|uniref:Uncharacterized protein n=1 Tax=Reticulomyxa filosa TaxID=46433 RepID=X6P0E0_RETFI|nr:hypothetical protein RFI_05411 [Reticulomyxa filosa]|eukprot:ETO31701.1 hypothetical protein RFI_05411 [Reticulomyxa filosa]
MEILPIGGEHFKFSQSLYQLTTNTELKFTNVNSPIRRSISHLAKSMKSYPEGPINVGLSLFIRRVGEVDTGVPHLCSDVSKATITKKKSTHIHTTVYIPKKNTTGTKPHIVTHVQNLMILLEWNIDEANYKLGRRKEGAIEEEEENNDGEYDDVIKQVLWKPKLSFPTLLESNIIFQTNGQKNNFFLSCFFKIV